MNKKTIETIQTNTLEYSERSFMTRSIKFVRCVIKKIVQRFDCVSTPERSYLAYYKFCNIIDTVLARE